MPLQRTLLGIALVLFLDLNFPLHKSISGFGDLEISTTRFPLIISILPSALCQDPLPAAISGRPVLFRTSLSEPFSYRFCKWRWMTVLLHSARTDSWQSDFRIMNRNKSASKLPKRSMSLSLPLRWQAAFSLLITSIQASFICVQIVCFSLLQPLYVIRQNCYKITVPLQSKQRTPVNPVCTAYRHSLHSSVHEPIDWYLLRPNLKNKQHGIKKTSDSNGNPI